MKTSKKGKQNRGVNSKNILVDGNICCSLSDNYRNQETSGGFLKNRCYRCSMFYNKATLKNFQKFIEEHLHSSLFINKVASLFLFFSFSKKKTSLNKHSVSFVKFIQELCWATVSESSLNI